MLCAYSLFLEILLYLEAIECNTTVMLHSNLHILEKETKTVLENDW